GKLLRPYSAQGPRAPFVDDGAALEVQIREELIHFFVAGFDDINGMAIDIPSAGLGGLDGVAIAEVGDDAAQFLLHDDERAVVDVGVDQFREVVDVDQRAIDAVDGDFAALLDSEARDLHAIGDEPDPEEE